MSSYCICAVIQVVQKMQQSSLSGSSNANTISTVASQTGHRISENATILPVFTCSRKLLCIRYLKEKNAKSLVQVFHLLQHIRN